MACDTNQLLEEAKCVIKCIPPGMLSAVQVALLCQIAEGGGTGGSTQVYIDRAPAPPDNPALAALSYPAGGGTLSQWDVATAQWV